MSNEEARQARAHRLAQLRAALPDLDWHDLVLMLGVSLVVAGVSYWSRPAALVVAGVAIIILALMSASTTKRG